MIFQLSIGNFYTNLYTIRLKYEIDGQSIKLRLKL